MASENRDVPLAVVQNWGNGTEELRVSVNEYNGRHYFAVRVWFQGRNQQMFPGKQGLNVPLDRADELRDVIAKGLSRLVTLARRDLLPGVKTADFPPNVVEALESGGMKVKGAEKEKPQEDARD